jgi:hypothetical protein
VDASVGRRLAAATAVALVLLGIGAASASAEPNDTAAGASGPIQNGATYQDVIATENDVDWWVFYTGASTQLDIALLGLGPDHCFGPVMGLYDANGQVITQDDYPTEANETHHLLRTVAAGTFYVKVEPYNIGPCFGSEALYRLWINSSPALLASPYVPPPPAPPAAGAPLPDHSAIRAAKTCEHARGHVAGLLRKLRRAHGINYRNAIRRDLRRAQAEVRRRCS